MGKWFALIFLLIFLARCSEDNSKSKQQEQLSRAEQLLKPGPDVPAVPAQATPWRPEKQARQVRHKKKIVPLRTEALPEVRAINDSMLIRRLKDLRARGIEPDLNEPVTWNYLLSGASNPKFASMITLSRERLLQIHFDNDILDNTDRYYTNGIRFDFISPVFSRFPVCRILVPYQKNAQNYYGISIVQNMYTPSTTKVGGILYGDRPYAAYLYLGTFKITNDLQRKIRQISEIDLGVIGPSSYGDFVQKTFHNNVPTNSEPLGWEYQIQNDLLLNYDVMLEKGLLSLKSVEFNLYGTGQLGTLYTNLGGGLLFRTGVMNPYFTNLGISKRATLKENGLRVFQFIFQTKALAKFVGYDATLEGGMLNHTNVYTIPAGDISRFVFQGSACFTLSYGGFSYTIEQFFLSPEFRGGGWHNWVHMGLLFCL
jgi:lipid A 3-O-deacylase